MINEQLLAWARTYIGLSEVEGDASHPIILDMAKHLGVPHYVSDEQQWCGLFMANVADAVGAEVPSSFLLASSWRSVGRPVYRRLPGDVVILDSHVGLYTGEDDKHVWLLGGNQANQVREYFYDKARIVEVRRLRTAV